MCLNKSGILKGGVWSEETGIVGNVCLCVCVCVCVCVSRISRVCWNLGNKCLELKGIQGRNIYIY